MDSQRPVGLIATKGGIVIWIPEEIRNWWADFGFGLKYVAVDDEENQLLVTPGLKLELPSGSGDFSEQWRWRMECICFSNEGI